MKKSLFYCLAFMALVACNTAEQPKQFIDLTAIDTTVRPQDDFFQYANGAWLERTEIPASESGWGSFYILGEKSTKDLQSLFNELLEGDNYAKGSLEQLTADFYKSGMDSLQVEEMGFDPVKAELAIIKALQSPEEIIPEISREIKSGNVPLAYNLVPAHLITFYVYQDDMNSDQYIAQFGQGDLGLPTNEYYLKTDSASVATREKYLVFIADLFKLMGETEKIAKGKAQNILALETKLAKASRTPNELRDPIANYNKFSVAELEEMMPAMAWSKLINDLGVEADTVQVGQPEYFEAFGQLVYSEPIKVWQDMLSFWTVVNNARHMSNEFVTANFGFYSRTLYGQQEMKPRWKRMSRTVNAALGDAMGQLYVAKFFPPEAKERMNELVDNLLAAYAERIQAVTWMTDSTKQKALTKLSAMSRKIGYPDRWDDYDGVEIDRGTYLENIRSVRRYAYNEMIAKLGQPIDKDQWVMTPPTVNAYYSPNNNEIVFPAGILQPPFFDKDADDAVNYGAIGMVIAHEVTHGFDDSGRNFDAEGNMIDWWTEQDAHQYEEKTEAIISQFNAYEIIDGLHVDGELTQGENIADLGGLTIAYDAFKLTEQGQSDELVDGLTPDQRFFLAYSKVWMIKTTDESLRQQVLADEHAPASVRVNGPLQNMPAFHAAFDVQPGDALYRPDSSLIAIW